MQQFEMVNQVEYNSTDNPNIHSCKVNDSITNGIYIGLTISHQKSINIDTLTYPAPNNAADVKSYLLRLQNDGTASKIHAFESNKMRIYKVIENPMIGIVAYHEQGSLSFGSKTLTAPYQFFAFFNTQMQPCYLQTFKLDASNAQSYLDLGIDAIKHSRRCDCC